MKKEKKNKTYKIYISSAAGLDYTGVWTHSEEEAKRLCKEYDGPEYNPYAQHIYVEV